MLWLPNQTQAVVDIPLSLNTTYPFVH